jgi:hypothetical protein
MKNIIKSFNEENLELEDKFNSKLNLLQSPINFMDDKEALELKTSFDKYCEKIEKIISNVDEKYYIYFNNKTII